MALHVTFGVRNVWVTLRCWILWQALQIIWAAFSWQISVMWFRPRSLHSLSKI